MQAKDIKSVDDVSNYIEGCLNDYDEALSTREETIMYLHQLTVKVIEMAQKHRLGSQADAKQIFDGCAQKHMINWNLGSFQETHPRLYKAIIEAIESR